MTIPFRRSTRATTPSAARGPVRAFALLALVSTACLAGAPAVLSAQTAPELSFIRAIGDHYGLPAAEVAVLAEWRIPIAEMPVAVVLADRAGISADALVALRRNGRSWPTLAARYGLGVSAFHVDLSDPPAPVATLYAELGGLPRSRWGEATFDDAQMIFLVNVRFLQEYVDTSADAAAAALARLGSPAEALRALGS